MEQRVVISGYLLSALLHECLSSASEATGLLFGEASSTVRRELTDTQEDGVVRSRTLAITRYLCTGGKGSLCDSRGNVDKELVRSCEVASTQPLCGYFTTRRSALQDPSIRDVGMLRSLSSDGKEPILLILTYIEARGSWTQEFPYSCFRLAGDTSIPVRVPLTIRNMNYDIASEHRQSQSLFGDDSIPPEAHRRLLTPTFSQVFDAEDAVDTKLLQLQGLVEELAAVAAEVEALEAQLKSAEQSELEMKLERNDSGVLAKDVVMPSTFVWPKHGPAVQDDRAATQNGNEFAMAIATHPVAYTID